MPDPELEASTSRRYTSRAPEQTEALAERLGRLLPAGSVLALEGELGAGKTCFVRGLARGLGIVEEIQSPTYQLMQATEGGRLTLYHFDAWMEGRELDFLEDGGGDWLEAGGIAAVEWAARVERWLPSPRIEVRLEHLAPESRGIELALVGDSSGVLGQALAGVLRGLPEWIDAAAERPAKPGFRPLRDCGKGLPKRPRPEGPPC